MYSRAFVITYVTINNHKSLELIHLDRTDRGSVDSGLPVYNHCNFASFRFLLMSLSICVIIRIQLIKKIAILLFFQFVLDLQHYRGVDNGAAGTAAAAPILWLVVVLQK